MEVPGLRLQLKSSIDEMKLNTYQLVLGELTRFPFDVEGQGLFSTI